MTEKNNKTVIYTGKALSLYREEVEFPDGHRDSLEIIRHPGGAGAVALDAQGQVCLIRQYRYAADDWLREIPAGRLEDQEAPLAAAQRELAEEAGVEAQEWLPLTTFFPSPGICDERIHVFVARQLQRVAHNHETLEYIEIHWVPLVEALRWCRQGKISDAKTQLALLHVQDLV